jgi:HK97 family phage prohead protease
MKQATFPLAEWKAADGPRSGLFAALVSVFNTIDRVGDRVVPGAFSKSLERWRSSGSNIPVIWSHDHKNAEHYIGQADPQDVKETKAGLVVAGKLDIEDNPNAARIFNLLERGLVKNWSFAYEVKQEELGDDLARNLVEVDLLEIGPTLVGANSETRTLALKEAPTEVSPEQASASAELKLDAAVAAELARFEGDVDALIEAKIGRAISSKTEAKIRAALAALEQILSSDGEEMPEQASSTPAVKSPAEGPIGENELLRLALTDAGVFLAERTA